MLAIVNITYYYYYYYVVVVVVVVVNRGSSVGIAAGYGLDDRGVGVRVPVR
jgi:hypothetical protein